MQKPTPNQMNRMHAAALAVGVIVLGTLGARAAGFDLAAALLLLVPFAIALLPARTAAEVVGTGRQRGLLAAALLGAIRSAAEACTALAAGAVLRLLAPLVELNLSVTRAAEAACINLHDAAISARGLCAQMLAQRGAIAATLSAQVLPAPRAAAPIRAA